MMLKGLRIAKIKIYILAPAQTKRMQPILVSWEEPFRSNLQKKNTGQVRVIRQRYIINQAFVRIKMNILAKFKLIFKNSTIRFSKKLYISSIFSRKPMVRFLK